MERDVLEPRILTVAPSPSLFRSPWRPPLRDTAERGGATFDLYNFTDLLPTHKPRFPTIHICCQPHQS